MMAQTWLTSRPSPETGGFLTFRAPCAVTAKQMSQKGKGLTKQMSQRGKKLELKETFNEYYQ